MGYPEKQILARYHEITARDASVEERAYFRHLFDNGRKEELAKWLHISVEDLAEIGDRNQ